MAAPELFGRYRVVRQLGAGAFASVWLARDEQLDGPVAVKVLADNWASRGDVRERFLEEARMLRRADSDRVVRVHDIGELDDGRPYFVMTYADAGTLADRLTDDPMPVGEALWYACETARSVAVLHSRGIIHRDLKPSNVLLRTGHDDTEQVLVSDLGLAKGIAFASGITLAAGTPGYMPPEQAEGTGLTFASDVYALGALTYRLLAGRLPRQVGTPMSVLTTAGDPVPSLELVAALPAGIEAVLRQALSRDPGERQADARLFVRALGAAAGGPLAADLAADADVAHPGTRQRFGARARESAFAAAGVPDAAPTVVTGVRPWLGATSTSSPPAQSVSPLSVLDDPRALAPAPAPRRGHRGFALAGGLGFAVVVAALLVLAVGQPSLVADVRAALHGDRVIRTEGFTVTVPRGWSQLATTSAPIPGGGRPVASLVVSSDAADYADPGQDGVYIGLVDGDRAATERAALTYAACTAPAGAPGGVRSWTGQAVTRSCVGGSRSVLTWIGTSLASPTQTLLVEVKTGAGDQATVAGRLLGSVSVSVP